MRMFEQYDEFAESYATFLKRTKRRFGRILIIADKASPHTAGYIKGRWKSWKA